MNPRISEYSPEPLLALSRIISVYKSFVFVELRSAYNVFDLKKLQDNISFISKIHFIIADSLIKVN